MDTRTWVEFELRVAGLFDPLSIRIRPGLDRCIAAVEYGSRSNHGIGTTAREALVAALAPLGARTASAVMAAPAMFGASAALLEVEAG